MKKNEILFRGKVNNKWEYFGLDSENVPDNIELNQWTGYEDSYHNKIFEGDIVEITARNNAAGKDGAIYLYLIWFEKEGQERWAYILKNFNRKYEIGFNGNDYYGIQQNSNFYSDFVISMTAPYLDNKKTVKVLGNVYDNPELLNDYMRGINNEK